MKLETARRRAKLRALPYRPYVITNEKQTDDAWVFSLGDPDGEIVDADLPMFVYDKEGSGVRDVYPPSKEGFALLKELRPI